MTELETIMNEQKKSLVKAIKDSDHSDANCPFTGSLKVRGRLFTGVVVSRDTHHTAQVEWSVRKFIRKYDRFLQKKTRVSVHNPKIIDAQVADVVVLAECRPLSKTKRFVIIKNLGHSRDFAVKQEVIGEDKKIALSSLHRSSSDDVEGQDNHNQKRSDDKA